MGAKERDEENEDEGVESPSFQCFPLHGSEERMLIHGAGYSPSRCHPLVAAMAASQPTLLTLAPRTLDKKVEFVSRILRLERRWDARAVSIFKASPSRCLPLTLPVLCRRKSSGLILEHPLLLSVSSSNLEYKLTELAYGLGISAAAAVTLFSAHPTHALTATTSRLRRILLTFSAAADRQLREGTMDAEGGGSGPSMGNAGHLASQGPVLGSFVLGCSHAELVSFLVLAARQSQRGG